MMKYALVILESFPHTPNPPNPPTTDITHNAAKCLSQRMKRSHTKLSDSFGAEPRRHSISHNPEPTVIMILGQVFAEFVSGI